MKHVFRTRGLERGVHVELSGTFQYMSHFNSSTLPGKSLEHEPNTVNRWHCVSLQGFHVAMAASSVSATVVALTHRHCQCSLLRMSSCSSNF